MDRYVRILGGPYFGRVGTVAFATLRDRVLFVYGVPNDHSRLRIWQKGCENISEAEYFKEKLRGN